MKKYKFTRKFALQISGVLRNAEHFRHFQAHENQRYSKIQRIFGIYWKSLISIRFSVN